MTATFKHVCDGCDFIGSICIRGQTLDLYVCGNGVAIESYVIRYGEEQHEYYSMPADISESILEDISKHRPLTGKGFLVLGLLSLFKEQ